MVWADVYQEAFSTISVIALAVNTNHLEVFVANMHTLLTLRVDGFIINST